MGNSDIKESDYEKLLGISFDKKLNFKRHMEDLCRKTNQRIHTLARLSNYIDPVKSEITYCPLVWMYNDRVADAKLNHTFEKHYGRYSKAVNQC